MGTYFTNGKATISVTVHDWDDTTRQYTPDRSADFYDVGSLKSFVAFMFGRYELVYVCDSIDSLIDQASDAVYGIGRYDTPSPNLVVDITTPVASPSRRREQVMTMAPRTMGTYFTNGKAMISFTIHKWDDTTRQHTPDFYGVGSRQAVGEIDNKPVYACDSIDGLIDQANDAIAGVGSYDTPSPNLVVDITTPVVSPSRLREQVMTMAPRTIDADDTIRDDRAMLVTTLIRALAAADAGNVHTVAASLARAHDITERLIAADEAGM